MTSNNGFSLYEMLIALSIFTLSGFALLELLNSRLLNLQQIRLAEQVMQKKQLLYRSSDPLNPLIDHPGAHQTGTIGWEWDSQTIEEQEKIGYTSGLYILTVTLDTDSPAQEQSIQRLKMGYLEKEYPH